MCGIVQSCIKIALSTHTLCCSVEYELVAQNRFIMCSIDCTGDRTSKNQSPAKKRAKGKCCRKSATHNDIFKTKIWRLQLKRILIFPYSPILSIDRTLGMKIGAVRPQNFPWPCIASLYSSKKFQVESFSFWQVSSKQLLNMRNFVWKLLQEVSKNFSDKKTMMRGMSKNYEISCVLHVPKAQLDTSCSDVATSPTDVDSVDFLPQPHFTSNELVSLNLSMIFFRPNAVFGSDPLLKHFIS